MLARILTPRRRQDDEGATAVEYGLMASLIAAVIIAAVTLLGSNLSAVFNSVAGILQGVPETATNGASTETWVAKVN